MAIFSALPPPWPSWVDEWHCPWPIIRSLFCFLGADWLPMTSSEFHMWAGAELRGESGAPGDPTVFVDDSRVPLTPNLINHLIYSKSQWISETRRFRRALPRSWQHTLFVRFASQISQEDGVLARSTAQSPTLGGVTVFSRKYQLDWAP